MNKENYSKIFIILLSLNITCLLISNIITIKTINIFGLIFTAGDILFPITYKAVDLIKRKEKIDNFDNEVKYKIF